MANDAFVVNTRVETQSNGKLVDFANFGTDPTKPNYGGANEHWLSYSDMMIRQCRRAEPTADIYAHIEQLYSNDARVDWDRFSDSDNVLNTRS